MIYLVSINFQIRSSIRTRKDSRGIRRNQGGRRKWENWFQVWSKHLKTTKKTYYFCQILLLPNVQFPWRVNVYCISLKMVKMHKFPTLHCHVFTTLPTKEQQLKRLKIRRGWSSSLFFLLGQIFFVEYLNFKKKKR